MHECSRTRLVLPTVCLGRGLLFVVGLPSLVNDVGMNRIRIFFCHFQIRESEFRRIGEAGHHDPGSGVRPRRHGAREDGGARPQAHERRRSTRGTGLRDRRGCGTSEGLEVGRRCALAVGGERVARTFRRIRTHNLDGMGADGRGLVRPGEKGRVGGAGHAGRRRGARGCGGQAVSGPPTARGRCAARSPIGRAPHLRVARRATADGARSAHRGRSPARRRHACIVVAPVTKSIHLRTRRLIGPGRGG